MSRPVLEAAVRQRVMALHNVRILDGCDVLGLVWGAGRVTGVRSKYRDGNAEEQIPADLVVDACGRGSRAPTWLEAMGYPKPEVEVVEVGMGYATRLYRREPQHLGGDVLINSVPYAKIKRGGIAIAQEGDRWIVTLAGYFGDHSPTDEAGFLEFAKSLPNPDLYELLRTATSLTHPVPYKFPANQRHRYERLTRFPEGFLVMGDAICGFSPIYGQGMTVAALEALAQRECRAEGPARLARRFFKRAARAVDVPWSVTVGGDSRLSDRPQLLKSRFMGWYLGRLHHAAQRDPLLALAFMNVADLLTSPRAYSTPKWSGTCCAATCSSPSPNRHCSGPKAENSNPAGSKTIFPNEQSCVPGRRSLMHKL
ncbi:MAG: FAD-binding monooxygenase [Meiothermus sp.]